MTIKKRMGDIVRAHFQKSGKRPSQIRMSCAMRDAWFKELAGRQPVSSGTVDGLRCFGCQHILVEGVDTSWCASKCMCLGAVWCLACWNLHIDRIEAGTETATTYAAIPIAVDVLLGGDAIEVTP